MSSDRTSFTMLLPRRRTDTATTRWPASPAPTAWPHFARQTAHTGSSPSTRRPHTSEAANRFRCFRCAAASRPTWRGPTLNEPSWRPTRMTQLRRPRDRDLFTVVWSTGGVGSIAIDAIRRGRTSTLLESGCIPRKGGKDAGELAGGEPIGVTATKTPTRLSRCGPTASCMPPADPNATRVRYPITSGCSSRHQRRVDVVHQPGVSTCVFSPEWRDQMETAAKSGNASFYASGIFPGFGSDQLALLLGHALEEDRLPEGHRGRTQRPLSGGRRDDERHGLRPSARLRTAPEDPGFIEMAWGAPIHLIAAGLGVEVEEVHGTLDRRH